MGACHGLEIGFVFGTYGPDFCGSGPLVESLSEKIQEAWAAFARTGSPDGGLLGDWPQYCHQRKTMILGEDTRVEEAPYEAERLFWQNIDNRAKNPA